MIGHSLQQWGRTPLWDPNAQFLRFYVFVAAQHCLLTHVALTLISALFTPLYCGIETGSFENSHVYVFVAAQHRVTDSVGGSEGKGEGETGAAVSSQDQPAGTCWCFFCFGSQTNLHRSEQGWKEAHPHRRIAFVMNWANELPLKCMAIPSTQLGTNSNSSPVWIPL